MAEEGAEIITVEVREALENTKTSEIVIEEEENQKDIYHAPKSRANVVGGKNQYLGMPKGSMNSTTGLD